MSEDSRATSRRCSASPNARNDREASWTSDTSAGKTSAPSVYLRGEVCQIFQAASTLCRSPPRSTSPVLLGAPKDIIRRCNSDATG